MSQKISTAESENIKVYTEVEDITLEFINDLDITVIFANLWDNAIEACLKTEIEKRFINIHMERFNGFIILNMENSFNGKVNKKERLFYQQRKTIMVLD